MSKATPTHPTEAERKARLAALSRLVSPPGFGRALADRLRDQQTGRRGP